MLRRKQLTNSLFQESLAKKPTSRYKLHIIRDRCKGCRLCTEFCSAHVLALSDEFNVKGYHFPILAPGKVEADCTGCEYCQIACPEFAIFVSGPFDVEGKKVEE